jgi:putative DNA primase/helicase
MALCPLHDDRNRSLSISEGKDGHILVNCFAGCPTHDVLAVVRLRMSNLMPNSPMIVATYDYKDADGNLLYQSLRMEPKSFRCRRPDGQGGWVWKNVFLGVKRVPYRLPELLAADSSQLVFIVEGEKDADRLASLGLAATTNVDGAGKWRDEYNQPFKGRHVVILPDNDEPGREHAETVATALLTVAATVKILDLTGLPDKGDVSDWLDAGENKAKLLALAKRAPPYEPTAKQVVGDKELAALKLMPLSAVQSEEFEWLWDKRIPLRGPTAFAGEGGVGKTLLVIDIASRISTGTPFPDGAPCEEGVVLFFSEEDDAATVLKPRFEAHNADCDKIIIQGAEAEKWLNLGDNEEKGLALLEKVVASYGGRVRTIVFDPITAYMKGKDIYRDDDVRAVLRPLTRLCQKYKLAVLNVLHFGKDSELNVKYRSLGSVTFINSSRAGWAVGKEYEEDEVVHMLQTKKNYTRPVGGLMFDVHGEGGQKGRGQAALGGAAQRARRRRLGPGQPRHPAQEAPGAGQWLLCQDG